MELLKCVPLYIVIVTMVAGRQRMSEADIIHLIQQHERILSKDSKEGPTMCTRLAMEPYLGVEMLLGQTWRIHYTWNMDLQKQCFDMTFRKATPSIINRMREYLKTEPYWDTASVLVRLGHSNYEMLLFADQGSPGMFHGVPNLIQDGRFPDILMTTNSAVTPFSLLRPANYGKSKDGLLPALTDNSPEKAVPLLNFYLNLVYGGKYLLMADCQIDVATLSASKKNIPYHTEFEGIARYLDFGPGFQACMSDRKEGKE